MFTIIAHFNHNEVYVNQKSKYLTNEILTLLLDAGLSQFEKYEKQLNETLRSLSFSLDGSYDFIKEFNARAYRLQALLNTIAREVSKIPLYTKEAGSHDSEGLIRFLNRYKNLFKTVAAREHRDVYDDDDLGASEGDVRYADAYGFQADDLVEFIPRDFCYDEKEETDYSGIELYNEKLAGFLDDYIKVVQDILSVKRVYEPFINGYLHKHNRFLNEREFSELYREYLERNASGICLSPAGSIKLEYKVMQGNSKLYESYTLDGLGSFLYIDFFKGIQRNHIPKKCENCEKYFLLTGGKYSDYCERPLSDDTTKTCRDVGARRKYDDKCKTDPIWLTYNRAYKAHYARYMKKKMTVSEFEAWSATAVELREKAERGELGFEEYERAVRA